MECGLATRQSAREELKGETFGDEMEEGDEESGAEMEVGCEGRLGLSCGWEMRIRTELSLLGGKRFGVEGPVLRDVWGRGRPCGQSSSKR